MAALEIFADAEELATAAARRVTELVGARLEDCGRCSLVLAGGSTPIRLYRRLAEEPRRGRIDWSKVSIFWGDERAVPPDHPDSNYRQADGALLSRVPVRPEAVHRIAGERGAERAAADYELRLRRLFRPGPRFDLVLLGIGGDGHTASLFPATPDLSPGDRLVIATTAPVAPRERVSLTLRALNAAREVLFLARGSGKAAILRQVHAAGAGRELPAARVSPSGGTVRWMVDEAAAALL